MIDSLIKKKSKKLLLKLLTICLYRMFAKFNLFQPTKNIIIISTYSQCLKYLN